MRTGLAVGRLLRLQRAAGLRFKFYDLGLCTLARHRGFWFGGAFGRWAPLPSPALVRCSISDVNDNEPVGCDGTG